MLPKVCAGPCSVPPWHGSLPSCSGDVLGAQLKVTVRRSSLRMATTGRNRLTKIWLPYDKVRNMENNWIIWYDLHVWTLLSNIRQLKRRTMARPWAKKWATINHTMLVHRIILRMWHPWCQQLTSALHDTLSLCASAVHIFRPKLCSTTDWERKASSKRWEQPQWRQRRKDRDNPKEQMRLITSKLRFQRKQLCFAWATCCDQCLFRKSPLMVRLTSIEQVYLAGWKQASIIHNLETNRIFIHIHNMIPIVAMWHCAIMMRQGRFGFGLRDSSCTCIPSKMLDWSWWATLAIVLANYHHMNRRIPYNSHDSMNMAILSYLMFMRVSTIESCHASALYPKNADPFMICILGSDWLIAI